MVETYTSTIPYMDFLTQLITISHRRHYPVHIHPVPLHAGHHHQRPDRLRHRVLRLRHGPQRLRLAEGENDMRTTPEPESHAAESVVAYTRCGCDVVLIGSRQCWPVGLGGWHGHQHDFGRCRTAALSESQWPRRRRWWRLACTPATDPDAGQSSAAAQPESHYAHDAGARDTAVPQSFARQLRRQQWSAQQFRLCADVRRATGHRHAAHAQDDDGQWNGSSPAGIGDDDNGIDRNRAGCVRLRQSGHDGGQRQHTAGAEQCVRAGQLAARTVDAGVTINAAVSEEAAGVYIWRLYVRLGLRLVQCGWFQIHVACVVNIWDFLLKRIVRILCRLNRYRRTYYILYKRLFYVCVFITGKPRFTC